MGSDPLIRMTLPKLYLEIGRRLDLPGEPWVINEVKEDGTRNLVFVVSQQEPVFIDPTPVTLYCNNNCYCAQCGSFKRVPYQFK